MYFYSHNGVPFVDESKPTVEIDEIITRDINRAFFVDEQKKRDVVILEEEFKAELKKIGKLETPEKKLEATQLEHGYKLSMEALGKKVNAQLLDKSKKLHPPAGAEAFSCIITRDERKDRDEAPPRPENRYAIPMNLFDLGKVNIMGTEDIVEQATY